MFSRTLTLNVPVEPGKAEETKPKVIKIKRK